MEVGWQLKEGGQFFGALKGGKILYAQIIEWWLYDLGNYCILSYYILG